MSTGTAFGVRPSAYFRYGSSEACPTNASHFAAKTKSLSVSPPILCVHTSTVRRPHETWRSG